MKHIKPLILFSIVFVLLLNGCSSFIWSKRIVSYGLTDPEKIAIAQQVANKIRARISTEMGVKVRSFDGDSGSWATRSDQLYVRWDSKPSDPPGSPDYHRPPELTLIFDIWTKDKRIPDVQKIIEEEIKAAPEGLFQKNVYESHLPV